MQALFNQLDQALKAKSGVPAALQGLVLYPPSRFQLEGGGAVALARRGAEKILVETAPDPARLLPEFAGVVTAFGGLAVKLCPLSHANAVALRRNLPWTAPVSLRDKRTTLGCGDRLGRATPGHIRAVRDYDVYPVLAQQSIRELNLTGRTYERVVDDVTFLVLQEGFTRGYGADGDHLKTLKDIGVAIDAGMAMITLDLSEVMNAAAEHWSPSQLDEAFRGFPAADQARILAEYAGQSFDIQGHPIGFDANEAKRCTVMYLKAMDFAREVNDLLQARRGDAFDLEISIDETKAPTLPAHHLFIIRELLRRQVTVSSLAPRFIGEFQKAIDYIGNLQEFEHQFIQHCAIAAVHGGYKISIHSGSDKFSVYPAIGRHTNLRVHVKTAGTSWLEAVRTVAVCDPALYAELHRKALSFYPEALKYYHITPDLAAVPAADALQAAVISGLMDQNAPRQVVHITYGGILNDPVLGPRFFACLDAHEETYYTFLEKHFRRHLDKLGLLPV